MHLYDVFLHFNVLGAVSFTKTKINFKCKMYSLSLQGNSTNKALRLGSIHMEGLPKGPRVKITWDEVVFSEFLAGRWKNDIVEAVQTGFRLALTV